MSKKRKIHAPVFKAKGSLEAIRGLKTTSELASRYQGSSGPDQYLEKAGNRLARTLQAGQGSEATPHRAGAHRPLYEEIGRLQMELDWLKKVG